MSFTWAHFVSISSCLSLNLNKRVWREPHSSDSISNIVLLWCLPSDTYSYISKKFVPSRPDSFKDPRLSIFRINCHNPPPVPKYMSSTFRTWKRWQTSSSIAKFTLKCREINYFFLKQANLSLQKVWTFLEIRVWTFSFYWIITESELARLEPLTTIANSSFLFLLKWKWSSYLLTNDSKMLSQLIFTAATEGASIIISIKRLKKAIM